VISGAESSEQNDDKTNNLLYFIKKEALEPHELGKEKKTTCY